MSGVSLPVTRPAGRALVIATASSRAQPLSVLQRLGFTCAEVDDPYAAAVEVCRRPLVYGAVILSLTSFYREELGVVAMIKKRFPHIDIWLTHIDGRQAALAEAMRLGADGLLAEDGLHRTAMGTAQPAAPTETAKANEPPTDLELGIGEPILSAEELRALLQEQPSLPPSEEN